MVNSNVYHITSKEEQLQFIPVVGASLDDFWNMLALFSESHFLARSIRSNDLSCSGRSRTLRRGSGNISIFLIPSIPEIKTIMR